jgi:hypothetical protein
MSASAIWTGCSALRFDIGREGLGNYFPVPHDKGTSPRHPQDLKDHACIGFRFSNGLYRWGFEKGRKALTVSPQGPASFDDPDLVIQAVLDGVGIGTAMEDKLTDLIADGRLVQVLNDWCPSFPGYFLYYPSRRNQPAALTALIATLRLSEYHLRFALRWKDKRGSIHVSAAGSLTLAASPIPSWSCEPVVPSPTINTTDWLQSEQHK